MIDENTKISYLNSLSPVLRTKLLMRYSTVGDLLKSNIIEILDVEGVTTFDIACLVEVLNQNNYHLKGEEIINMSCFYTSDKVANLVKECDYLVNKRDNLRRAKIYKQEELALSNEIERILMDIKEIKSSQNLKR
jgi:hypothetical protein